MYNNQKIDKLEDFVSPSLSLHSLACMQESKRAWVIPSKVENLYQCWWKDGKLACGEDYPTMAEIRQTVQDNLRTLRQDHKRSLNPTPYKVSERVGGMCLAWVDMKKETFELLTFSATRCRILQADACILPSAFGHPGTFSYTSRYWSYFLPRVWVAALPFTLPLKPPKPQIDCMQILGLRVLWSACCMPTRADEMFQVWRFFGILYSLFADRRRQSKKQFVTVDILSRFVNR